ncbi:Ribokinase [Luteimonas sp. 9C]|uniref:ribokinase n=1 Tax=Luteimonas sp. 9C TaxID=2653148 RepID=UPI0012F3F4E5|nr:ribokinase [Luteimonas sp. 9C]VXC19095.1 Ribokinase [Luteimonas sp. 9C]
MRAGRVLVAGSANLDFVVRAAHIPAPGETVLGREFQTFPGGKGANQAVAAARAGGADTRMLLALGDDAYAVPVEASLREAGVALDIRRQPTHATGVAFICLADGAENAITVAPGANAGLVVDDLPDLAGIDTLLLQLETPIDAVTAWATRARETGVRVVLNAAPARVLPDALLRQVDVLIVNEGELATLIRKADDLINALKRVPVPTVVVTLGAAGCIAREGTALHLQPAFPVVALDTTAAGDTFCGVLVAALARGETLVAGLRAAAAASALACTALGAQSSVPARADVDALLRGDTDRAGLDALAARCASSAA